MSEREISESSGFSWHTALFVTLLSLARIAHGFFWAIPGPTLPSLELNVREDNVSLIFSYRSIGVFVGACLSGFFYPKIRAGKWRLFSLGLILCVNAIGLALMPILKGNSSGHLRSRKVNRLLQTCGHWEQLFW